jgi:hypothetical protein
VTDDATASSSSSISIITVEATVSCTLDLFFTKVPQRDVGSWISIVVVEFNCGVEIVVAAIVITMPS